MSLAGLSVARFGAARPWARPGTLVDVELVVRAANSRRARARIELLDGPTAVGSSERVLDIATGLTTYAFDLRLPEAPRRGYGLRLRLEGGGPRPIVRLAGVEAIEGWWESPRHVALTAFARARGIATRIRTLRDWHVTVAQAYDWMWRHYRYAGPTDPFVDALGRRVSHRSVRAAIDAAHASGIAALAYGSVYGAEREYVDEHPDERLFDDAGRVLSLGETFYMTDLRPRGAWRRRLLREYESACRDFGFDGIHMDTYGPPYEAVTADGARIRFDQLYPGLIREAADRVRGVGPERRVLFNCVEGFPLEAVSSAPAAALYLELWPPDDRFADLVRWIDRARAVADGRSIVIAAYAAALRDATTLTPAERAGAVEASILTTTVVMAAGAYHHTLAEADRLLVEGYYPAAVPLHGAEVRDVRAAWSFHARTMHLVSDPESWVVAHTARLHDAAGAPVPTSDVPIAGAVWVRQTATPSGRVLQLVDLTSQDRDVWTELREPSPLRSGWTLVWPARRLIAGSPWTDGGGFTTLRAGPGIAWPLPPFRRWLVAADPPASNGAPG